MKICPQCRNPFPDDFVFCMNDGTTLLEDEQETVVRDVVSSNQQNPPNLDQNGQAAPFVFPSFQNPSPQPQPENFNVQPPIFTPPGGQITSPHQTKSNKSSFLIVALLLMAAIGGAIFWYVNQPNPLESKLDKAIVNNKLFEPAGDNAYEIYKQLKKEGADEKVLKKFEDRIFPLLTTKPDEIIKTVVEIGTTEKDLKEWQDAAKMLEWASELRPAETQIAAKAAYCKGRVSYLNDNKSATIDNWKKAADLDKKWAVPVNGIGLIYNEQQKYEEAKKWLRQAIERDGNWAIPYNNLGTAHFHQKQFEEAAKYYRKAIEIAPRWARPHAWLGSIGEENYDYQLCITEFEIVLSPEAIGAGELRLDQIRNKKKKCEENLAYSDYGY